MHSELAFVDEAALPVANLLADLDVTDVELPPLGRVTVWLQYHALHLTPDMDDKFPLHFLPVRRTQTRHSFCVVQ